MAISQGKYKDYTKGLVRSLTVGDDVPGLSLVVDPADGRVAVTLAASSGTEVTITRADGATVTKEIRGVGFRDGEATAAVDGSWLFEVDGVTDGETVGTGHAGTARGTKVYVDASGDLTLDSDDGATPTATDNTFIGVIDDGRIVDGVAPIQIGVQA